MDHGIKAAENFLSGYNCAQAVAVAFAGEMGLTEQQAARMVSAFGGGMSRLREVCGAVSGMVFVMGTLYGYDDPTDDAGKKRIYTQVQELAGKFREENGSIICREILKNPASDPNPTPRSPEFYQMRPCDRMVYTAAALMDAFIAEHPLERNHG
jgi:C_GCAxxG_C_C family probable redox protein